jgi:hypothetical protein
MEALAYVIFLFLRWPGIAAIRKAVEEDEDTFRFVSLAEQAAASLRAGGLTRLSQYPLNFSIAFW